MNGVMLNGAAQSESDPDSDSDEFGQEPVTPDQSSTQASAATREHSRKQPSGQRPLRVEDICMFTVQNMLLLLRVVCYPLQAH